MSYIVAYSKTRVSDVLHIIKKEYQLCSVSTTNILRSNKLLAAYSKFAVLALTGWIEDGLDLIMQLPASNHKVLANPDLLSKNTSHIWNIGYLDFKEALRLTYGYHGYEYIENSLGQNNVQTLKSSLGLIKGWRDKAAHSNAQVVPCDPGTVIIEMGKIFPILRSMEKYARSYIKLKY